jgi:hypothetical protein
MDVKNTPTVDPRLSGVHSPHAKAICRGGHTFSYFATQHLPMN